MMATLSASDLERAAKQAVANLYEGSGRVGALSHKFKCLGGKPHLSGPAYPLVCPPGSNIWIHRAIYRAKPGDILIIATLGNQNHAYLGDLLVEAALQQKLGGIVIEGCVRDIENLKQMSLPVFAFGSAVDGPGKTTEGGSIEQPIQISKVKISKGDLVRGDEDGVVVIPRDKLKETLNAAEAREKKEKKVRKQIVEENIPLYKILGFKLP